MYIRNSDGGSRIQQPNMIPVYTLSTLAFLAGVLASPVARGVVFLRWVTQRYVMLNYSSPEIHPNGASNIHVKYLSPNTLKDEVVFVYGDCGLDHPDRSHHEVGRFQARSYAEKP